MEVARQGMLVRTSLKEQDIIKKGNGKIAIKCSSKSQNYVSYTMITLAILTVMAFIRFDYKDINFMEATTQTLANVKVMFTEASMTHFSFGDALSAVGITLALAFLTTILGAIIALFLSLFAARNLSGGRICVLIKGGVAIIRAIPTVLWVLIFAISIGLGSEAAIIGMTFHTVGYLIKAYAEAFEEIDAGVIEALKASGANWWQIIFQAVLPSSMSYIAAWTFMRFEINVANAIAMGAAAGAGGIGFELFMASNFYYNVREVGFITLMVLTLVIILEMISTKVKNKYL